MLIFDKAGRWLVGSSLLATATISNIAVAQTPPAPPTSTPPSNTQSTETAAPAPASPPLPKGTTQLPAISVTAPRPKPKEARRRPIHPHQTTVAGEGVSGGVTTVSPVEEQGVKLDVARAHILAPSGTNATTLTSEAIQALPQGTDAPLDKVLLQFPGVSQDSAASGELHVRNEHANLQYRINGIMLPDGVGAFGQILDTGIVGNMTLLTGALPAQYGLRTAGVLDIQTKANAFNNSGTVSVYGGSRGTITPNIEYGGTVGDTQYFLSGRYFGSDIGIENPTSSTRAIHDHTDQEKGLAYVSTKIDDYSRLVFIGGTSTSNYQIPNNPGQQPGVAAGSANFVTYPFDSARLNEHQVENNQFGVLAYQRSINGFDMQLAAFTRYSTLHFTPDVAGDLAFNGVASDVYRRSQVSGLQSDNAYRWADSHTLRFGFQVSGEQSLVRNSSEVLPVDPISENTTSDIPFNITDSSSKFGGLFSAYASDEWRLTNQLALTAGLRFDQMWSYTDANQFSPRINLTYKPFESTTVHAGYARNFTPPPQVLAAPTNLALVNATPNTQSPDVNQASPVRPERSHVFDVGVDQVVLPGLTLGVDAYYKIARDLLDDGQFGAAYVLTAFNYDRGYNYGVEFKGSYVNGNFRAYGNVAIAEQRATNIVSNQFLFDAADLAYIQSHYIYTDHAQLISGSAGASYLWNGTRFSADMIFGSGLRADGTAPDGSTIPNGNHLPFYTQVNLGLSHEFATPGYKPMTVRFDVVNAFDSIYQIRDGSGIGVFAPQYGPRRGFFVGFSQKL